MKKVLNFLKKKYGLILGCLLGIAFGFSLIAFIVNVATPTSIGADTYNVSAAIEGSAYVTCTSYNCGDGKGCGVVCCGTNDTGSVRCKNWDGSYWGGYTSFDI